MPKTYQWSENPSSWTWKRNADLRGRKSGEVNESFSKAAKQSKSWKGKLVDPLRFSDQYSIRKKGFAENLSAQFFTRNAVEKMEVARPAQIFEFLEYHNKFVTMFAKHKRGMKLVLSIRE